MAIVPLSFYFCCVRIHFVYHYCCHCGSIFSRLSWCVLAVFWLQLWKKGVKYLYTLWESVLTGGGWPWCLFFSENDHTGIILFLMKGWMLVSINEAVIMHTMVWFLSTCTFCVFLWTESKTFETSCTHFALSCQYCFVNCISLAIVVFWYTNHHHTWVQYL